jgi:carbonic anhydrase
MAHAHTLIDRNREFADGFDQGHLGIPPRLSTLIVTCLDARVDPAHFFGLELGDAFVIRSLGGRVTAELIEQIAILLGLTVVSGGAALEVAILHHTNCGAVRFGDARLRQQLSQVSGVDEGAIERFAASDPQSSVAEDVERLRAAPELPDDLVVAGYVYDVTDGRVREVVPPAPLREGAR